MTTTLVDIRHLAAQTRLVGELLDRDGETAWRTTKAWATGPAAANLDPDRGGNRTWTDPDTGETWPIQLGDPVGDGALEGDTAIDLAHQSYQHLLDDLEQTTTELLKLIRAATPTLVRPAKEALVEAGLADDGWCTSCYRDGRYLQPIDTRPSDGRPYYTDLCRWCGEFRKGYRRLPPIELLKARHEGRRITQQMVTHAFAKRKIGKRKRAS